MRGVAQGKPMFWGKALPYDSWSNKLIPQQSGGRTSRSFVEQFAQGAFGSDLARSDVVATWNHNPQFLLGRTQAGTLRLKDEADGLYVECDRVNTSYANDLAALIDSGDIAGMSFQFRSIAHTMARLADHDQITIKQAHLREVSFVTNPCYANTEANSRDMQITSKIDPLVLKWFHLLGTID